MPCDRQQVNDLFDAAVELLGTERGEFLARECAGDRELRAEVESLLAADADLSRFIENPILSIPPEIFPDATTELTGQQLGSYRIVREIGRGGLGKVYLAERADDAYRKEVAIKLIRRGLDT
ncbi:MAG: serine/threonine protein kinase, partial [Chthoniobacterales bacterium]|nr:serine/threonine protein kinase [Chthoniobacterales bacterium]